MSLYLILYKAKIQKEIGVPWIKDNNPIQSIFWEMHFQNATATFNHSTSDQKNICDIKEGKIIPEQQHVDLPRTGKRVLNEELHYPCSVHLGLEDSLENVLKKGSCSCTKACHLCLRCSMLHGSLFCQRKSNLSYLHWILQCA